MAHPMENTPWNDDNMLLQCKLRTNTTLHVDGGYDFPYKYYLSLDALIAISPGLILETPNTVGIFLSDPWLNPSRKITSSGI